jgi:hypothetical protein
MRRTVLGTAAVLAAATMTACGDSGSPSTDSQMNFNLATRPAGSAAALGGSFELSSTGASESYTDGTNTLVIDRVQLVLREIELKRTEAGAVSCSDPGTDSCEQLELGPVLLDLPLGGAGGAARTFAVTVAPGSYREVEFEIHKPSRDDDAAFLQANPGFEEVSVKVTGSFNGQPFTFTSDLDAEEEVELSPPLVTTESAATDLTLFVDVDRWFRSESNTLVDPASANSGGPNESLVKSNITTNLHAFEDEDHDGTDDHGGLDG